MFKLRQFRLGSRRLKYLLNAVGIIAVVLVLSAAFSSRSRLLDTSDLSGQELMDALSPQKTSSLPAVTGSKLDKVSGAELEKQSTSGESLDDIKAGADAEADALRDSAKNADAKEDTEEAEKLAEIAKNAYNDPTGTKFALAQDYYRKVFRIFRQGHPNTDKVFRVDDKKVENVGVASLGDSPALTKEYLSSFIKLSPDQLTKLKQAHKMVVDKLPDTYPKGLYSGDGIVYVGGGEFNWYALISIKNLRRMGCTLPIEIVIPNLKEYETDLCRRVFPAYGTHCIFLPKVLDDSVRSDFLFQGYQYKALALMISSFENVLLLDADNVPAYSPDSFFDKEPFNSSGLVVWPDFWKRTTSPYFYDIAGLKLNEGKRTSTGYATYGKYEEVNCPKDKVLMHQLEGAIPDPSCESGQLMISKKKHTKDILLSLYYNMYGPDYFYPLFSQGAAGEGDKETFIAAAHALHKPYYQVRKLVTPIGMFKNGEFRGVAMRQVNPVQDYDLTVKYKDSVEKVEESPDFMFLHINFPKLDPIKLREEELTYNSKTKERNRYFGDEFIDETDYDFELNQWRSMQMFACDLQIEFSYFKKKKISRQELCDEIGAQLSYLEGTTRKSKPKDFRI
ncbi:DEKNAAC102798 [Brettanomyces naardenensis]|uniref:DEKNAAC102798 n=1 Tax=Brettanomyces naardenensis TaxID=13370 RepID=A0A448YK52_BRENA|nr:DEKNAAC102798 [Brettanomyces naardenensis]